MAISHNNGGNTDYYRLPPNCKTLLDLIEFVNKKEDKEK